MTRVVRGIMDWYRQFNGLYLYVKTEKNKLFEIEVTTAGLPHLLGLQYMNSSGKEELKGMRLYRYCYELSDKDIYNKVYNNHPEQLVNVKARIATFRYFMEHLEEAKLVERTNKHTSVRSQHFFVEIGEDKYMHLGLLSTGSGEIIDNFSVVNKRIMETYLVNKFDGFSRGSKIMERIRSIERYDEASDSYVPFSFNEEKNKVLLAEYNARHSKPSVLAEIKEAKTVVKARDKPGPNKAQDRGLEL